MSDRFYTEAQGILDRGCFEDIVGKYSGDRATELIAAHIRSTDREARIEELERVVVAVEGLGFGSASVELEIRARIAALKAERS